MAFRNIFRKQILITTSLLALVPSTLISQEQAVSEEITRSAVDLVLEELREATSTDAIATDNSENQTIQTEESSSNDSDDSEAIPVLEAVVAPEVVAENLDPEVGLDREVVVEAVSAETQNSAETQSVEPEIAVPVALIPLAPVEVEGAISGATGLENFEYSEILGADGEINFDPFTEPMETELTASALAKDKSQTPAIFKALRKKLEGDFSGLEEDEREAILAAYIERKGELIFVSNEQRQAAVETTIAQVQKQGLPKSRYEFNFPQSPNTVDALAQYELAAAAFTVRYGNDMERGIVAPNDLGSQFDLVPEGRPLETILTDMAKSDNPQEFFNALEPNDPDYAPLKAELAKYEELYLKADLANIPPVPEGATLRIGAKDNAVAILRQRLEAVGFEAVYIEPEVEANTAAIAAQIEGTVTSEGEIVPAVVVDAPDRDPNLFDVELAEAVKAYQKQAGLGADGIAGPRTLQTINGGPRQQMAPLLIAMERHRWGPQSRAGRQIFVNIASFMTEVRDDNVKTFETRVVVGKNDPKYRTPEFHDKMEYIVINPEWNVPWSIAVDEMLPRLQSGRGYGSSFKMLNGRGKEVNMANVDFNKFTKKTFPYRFVQENGPTNALGNVKFIFPNKHNIYLHDTPSKSLFGNSNRAYSHGCVRVGDPVDLATHLMGAIYSNPRAKYDEIRATHKQRFVELTEKVPVFLTYFTTHVDDLGVIHRERDVYGRDNLLQKALAEKGVEF